MFSLEHLFQHEAVTHFQHLFQLEDVHAKGTDENEKDKTDKGVCGCR